MCVLPGSTYFFFGLYPMYDATKVSDGVCVLISNLPSKSEVTPTVVPSKNTFTKGSGSPELASVIFPDTTVSWANDGREENQKRQRVAATKVRRDFMVSWRTESSLPGHKNN